MLGLGSLVLFFYPADFTPVCTREACLFRDAEAEFAALGAKLLGISADPPDKHRAFARKYGLSYPLLTDSGDLADRYRVKSPLGLGTRRVTYVVDPEGVIRGVFHHELRATKHVDEVRALLNELAGPNS